MGFEIANSRRPIFEKILRLETTENDLDRVTDLVLEERGKLSSSEARGYDRTLNARKLDQLVDPDEVSEFLYSFCKESALIEYSFKQDRSVSVMTEKNSQIETKQITEHRVVNLFYHNSGIIFIHGPYESVQEGESLARYLFQDTKVTEVLFESDFLLWMVYKNQMAEPLGADITLQRITGAEILGDDRTLGYNISESVSSVSLEGVWAGIYYGQELTQLEGEFDLFGYDITAKISAHRGITFNSSRGSLSDASEPKQWLLSLRFARRIIALFENWVDRDRQEKVPPKEFYDNIHSKVNESDTLYSLDEGEYPFSNSHTSVDPEVFEESEADILDVSLDEILAMGESEVVEFKSKLPDHRNNIAKEATALANFKGGVLVFGVDDNGEVCGIDDIRNAEETIMNILEGNVRPQLELGVNFESRDGSDVLVLRIPQFRDLPHAANYTFYIRRGTTKRKLTPYQLSYLMPNREENI
ncbi:helix-turn-helix domain-containing protein [Halomicrobium salinisoli]|uniref:AlbA family DNA-binding domain-containing protein n=1 Tax=Halomicrobium salinisoli TaxID=2878391 RepID=UPI001CF06BAB|nr:ATP-binding protein [Halomicrobium salinisoli]